LPPKVSLVTLYSSSQAASVCQVPLLVTFSFNICQLLLRRGDYKVTFFESIYHHR